MGGCAAVARARLNDRWLTPATASLRIGGSGGLRRRLEGERECEGRECESRKFALSTCFV